MKIRCFIGSSVEGLKYAEVLQDLLDRDLEVTNWDQDCFLLGETAIQSLFRILPTFDIAVFVFTPDDTIASRGNTYYKVRDNLIFEMGLFSGKLGQDKVLFITPRENKPELPTDLLGINSVTFDDTRTDGNLKAILGPTSRQIKKLAENIISSRKITEFIDEAQLSNYYKNKEKNKSRDTIEQEDNRIKIIKKLIDSTMDGLVYIDLDKIGAISDVFGISAGNYVIETAEQILKLKYEHSNRFVERFYGDTFIINCEADKAKIIAKDVLDSIKTFDWSAKTYNLFVTCCTGWSVRKYLEKKNDPEKWIIRAALGCINAKRMGGNAISEEVQFTSITKYAGNIFDS